MLQVRTTLPVWALPTSVQTSGHASVCFGSTGGTNIYSVVTVGSDLSGEVMKTQSA